MKISDGYIFLVYYTASHRLRRICFAPVWQPRKRSMTSMENAATRGDKEAVAELLREGASVGDSLHEAIESGHVEITAILVSHGVSLAGRDRLYHLTPMQTAAKHGPVHSVVPIVELLVAHGAHVEEKSHSPLYLAAMSGNFSAAVAFLAAGADATKNSGDFGDTPIHKAASTGCVNMLTALIASRPGGVCVVDRTRATALHYACGMNHSGAVDVLVDASADVEARDMFGRTPLVVAATEVCSLSAAAIVQRGADVDAVDENKQTALALVASQAGRRTAGDVEHVVDLLLRSGADETLHDKNGHAALDLVGRWMDFGCRDPEIVRVRALLQNAPRDRAWRRRGGVVLLRSLFVVSSDVRVAVLQAGQLSDWAGVTAWLLGAPVEIFRGVVCYI